MLLFCFLGIDILPHELSNDLSGRFVIRLTHFKKLLTQPSVDTYAKPHILHKG